jgi:hypothetical protein
MKVPVVPGLSRNKIEAKAISLLSELQPEALEGKRPVDIEAIFDIDIPECYRIDTGYADLSFLGPEVLGYTDASRKISYVDKTLSDSDATPTLRRCRSTIGHETGHCFLHVPILSLFKSTLFKNSSEGLYRAKRTEIKPYRDPEWQAWEFARSILMPRHLIFKYYEKGYSAQDMAEFFDLNPAFIDVRLKTLNLKPF